MSLLATSEHLPARTFQLSIVCAYGVPYFACGFIEFVEVGETADPIVSRVLQKMRDTLRTPPMDFPEVAFRDALSHWLLFNFDTPIHAPSLVPPSAMHPSS